MLSARAVLTTTVVLALIGCHNEQPRSTIVRGGEPFWCAANGECFNDATVCGAQGQCVEAHDAWCSRGSMGGNRYICAANKTRCTELALASREQFNNACEQLSSR